MPEQLAEKQHQGLEQSQFALHRGVELSNREQTEYELLIDYH